ncbi:MAG: tRNA (adenosine(37)-N6)-dimethylallyltransferase MiaA [Vicinamibacteria bacterium]|nr:tRNA (adenosine(37)-N6)-dimethylallyltransferase MiaA [Vicinamibacteria bacterium]
MPHHLIDVVAIEDAFSAARYACLARAAIDAIARRGRLPIVVGGSGLYLRALLHGLFEGPAADATIRARLKTLGEKRGWPRMHRCLRRIDPEYAARIAATDPVRIVRALEVYLLTGRPISVHHQEAHSALPGNLRLFIVGIAPERQALRERVIRRTRAMLSQGLIAEVRGLLEGGALPDARPLASIGYKQAMEVIAGRMTESAAEAEIVQATMRYAKRQMTWFRKEAGVAWFKDVESAWQAMRDGLDQPDSTCEHSA